MPYFYCHWFTCKALCPEHTEPQALSPEPVPRGPPQWAQPECAACRGLLVRPKPYALTTWHVQMKKRRVLANLPSFQLV